MSAPNQPSPGGAPGGGPPPPSGPVDFRSTPDYLGDRTIVLNSVMIAFSVIFVGLRLYSRLFVAKRPRLDDVFAVLALISLLALSSMDIRLVHVGSGTHMRFVPPDYMVLFSEAFTTQSLLYFWAVCFMRLQIVAFLPGIHPDNKVYKSLVYAVGTITVVSTLVVFFLRLFACRPVSALWLPPFLTTDRCMDPNTVDVILNVHSVLGITIDLCLVILPVWVIWAKMMLSTRKWRVLLVMSVGIFAVITGIVRYALIRTTPFQIDPTYSVATIGLWTVLEGHVGLWCGCFPAMQPVLRQVLSSIGQGSLMTRLATLGGGSSRSKTDQSRGGGGRSGIGKSGGGSIVRNGKHGGSFGGTRAPAGNHSDDDLSQVGIIDAPGSGRDEEFEMVGRGDDVKSDPRLPIMKSTTVELRYEQGRPPQMSPEGKRVDEESERVWTAR